MKHIEVDFVTKAPPQRVLSALTDFSPRRAEIWPDLAKKHYEVFEVGESWAVVREGSTKPLNVWAKEHYDWSQPGTVSWRVLESNFCTPGSYLSVDVEPDGEGSHVHLTWEREGKGFKGKLIVGMVAASKGKPIAAAAKKALDRLTDA